MREESVNSSETDKKLCQMLGGLNKIEAPKDFDFHLKAKIANAEPKKFRHSNKRRFVYALPVSALAIGLAAVGFYGNFFGTNEPTAAVEPTPQIQEIAAPQVSPTPQFAFEVAPTPNAISVDEKRIIVPKPAIQNRTAERETFVAEERLDQPRNNSKKTEKDASKVKALSVVKDVINQSDKDLDKMKNTDEEREFSSREVFETIGIETVTENGKLRVKSVRPNSPASRSGLSENDVIDSVNGKKVEGEKIRGKNLEVNKIRVKRGTENIELDLKPKQQ